MSAALDEETITHSHDVGFVNSCHSVATVSLGILEGKLGHSVTQIISMIVSNLFKTCEPSSCVLKNEKATEGERIYQDYFGDYLFKRLF